MSELDDAKRLIRPSLAIVLAAVAVDKGCDEGDLSLRVANALENFGLDCFRQGKQYAHERPTIPVPVGAFKAPVREPKRSDVFELDTAVVPRPRREG